MISTLFRYSVKISSIKNNRVHAMINKIRYILSFSYSGVIFNDFFVLLLDFYAWRMVYILDSFLRPQIISNL